eukprot:182477-Prymnesium_polylepis.1
MRSALVFLTYTGIFAQFHEKLRNANCGELGHENCHETCHARWCSTSWRPLHNFCCARSSLGALPRCPLTQHILMPSEADLLDELRAHAYRAGRSPGSDELKAMLRAGGGDVRAALTAAGLPEPPAPSAPPTRMLNFGAPSPSVLPAPAPVSTYPEASASAAYPSAPAAAYMAQPLPNMAQPLPNPSASSKPCAYPQIASSTPAYPTAIPTALPTAYPSAYPTSATAQLLPGGPRSDARSRNAPSTIYGERPAWLHVGARVRTQYTRAEGGDDRWYSGQVKALHPQTRQAT